MTHVIISVDNKPTKVQQALFDFGYEWLVSRKTVKKIPRNGYIRIDTGRKVMAPYFPEQGMTPPHISSDAFFDVVKSIRASVHEYEKTLSKTMWEGIARNALKDSQPQD